MQPRTSRVLVSLPLGKFRHTSALCLVKTDNYFLHMEELGRRERGTTLSGDQRAVFGAAVSTPSINSKQQNEKILFA